MLVKIVMPKVAFPNVDLRMKLHGTLSIDPKKDIIVELFKVHVMPNSKSNEPKLFYTAKVGTHYHSRLCELGVEGIEKATVSGTYYDIPIKNIKHVSHIRVIVLKGENWRLKINEVVSHLENILQTLKFECE